MGSASDVHPARKILAVVTVGGSSNSGAVLVSNLASPA